MERELKEMKNRKEQMMKDDDDQTKALKFLSPRKTMVQDEQMNRRDEVALMNKTMSSLYLGPKVMTMRPNRYTFNLKTSVPNINEVLYESRNLPKYEMSYKKSQHLTNNRNQAGNNYGHYKLHNFAAPHLNRPGDMSAKSTDIKKYEANVVAYRNMNQSSKKLALESTRQNKAIANETYKNLQMEISPTEIKNIKINGSYQYCIEQAGIGHNKLMSNYDVNSLNDEIFKYDKSNEFRNHIVYQDIVAFPVLNNTTGYTRAAFQTKFKYCNEQARRLATFANFLDNTNMYAITLAKLGFVYTGNRHNDEVTCFFCLQSHSNWQQTDDINIIHRQLSQSCPMAWGRKCSNVPYPTLIPPAILEDDQRERESNILTTPGDAFRIRFKYCNQQARRLATFANFPDTTNMYAINLAKLGFVYTGNGHNDEVTCFFCLQSHSNWQQTDDINIIHRQLSQSCPMAWGRNCNNVPYPTQIAPTIPEDDQRQEEIRTSSSLGDDQRQEEIRASSSLGDDQRGDEIGTSSSLGDVISPETGQGTVDTLPGMEAYSAFITQAHISRDFPNRNSQVSSSSSNIILESGPTMRCFFCEGVYRITGNLRNIWVEHAALYPSCGYVRLKNGYNFNETVRELAQGFGQVTFDMVTERMSLDISLGGPVRRQNRNELPHTSENMSHLTEESRRLESRVLCRLCQEERVEILYQPCGHLVTCVDCSMTRTTCVFCGVVVAGQIRVFLE